MTDEEKIKELEERLKNVEKLVCSLMKANKILSGSMKDLIEKQVQDNITTNENNNAFEKVLKKISESQNTLLEAFNRHVLEHKFTEGMNNYLSAEGFND